MAENYNMQNNRDKPIGKYIEKLINLILINFEIFCLLENGTVQKLV